MIRVQDSDFDIRAEIDALIGERTDIGAIVTFTGRVRQPASGPALESLTLEHYPGMTERELDAIESESRSRWPLDAVLIIHRHGKLLPGDNIVLVVTASAHRQAAFEAASFLMDYLKTRAPFWKQEGVVGDQARWVAAAESDTVATDRWSRR